MEPAVLVIVACRNWEIKMGKIAFYNNKQEQIMVSSILLTVVENGCFAGTLVLPWTKTIGLPFLLLCYARLFLRVAMLVVVAVVGAVAVAKRQSTPAATATTTTATTAANKPSTTTNHLLLRGN